MELADTRAGPAAYLATRRANRVAAVLRLSSRRREAPHGGQAWPPPEILATAVTVLAADSPLPAGLGEDLSALGIHRPAVPASRGDAGALLGGSAHVHVATGAAGSGPAGVPC